jgi:NAD(P)-dependent dehydrogenase (short-subunit alcohol dehydrogenase family)
VTSDALFSVTGKCVVVTGGTRGVGLMIARGLARAGARVYITSRSAADCRRVSAELSLWGDCEGVACDVANPDSREALARELARREPRLHALINNAGVTLGAPLDSFGDSEWDSVLSTNVKGLFLMTTCLLPQLEKGATADDPARIVNIGSIDGIHVPAVENYSYTASKAAVHHLTRHLAKRLGPRLTVNALALGPFESDMTDTALGREMAARTPLRRIGTAEDVAGSVQFLCSRAGAFVTGAVLPIDGGLATTR